MTFTIFGSTTFRHVRHVLCMGARMNMLWVWADTRRIVTLMKQMDAAWKWTIGKLVSIAMCCYVAFTSSYVAIPIGSFGTSPEPAIVSFDDSFPETLFWCFIAPAFLYMTKEISHRLAFSMAKLYVCSRCYVGFLSAATFA